MLTTGLNQINVWTMFGLLGGFLGVWRQAVNANRRAATSDGSPENLSLIYKWPLFTKILKMASILPNIAKIAHFPP